MPDCEAWTLTHSSGWIEVGEGVAAQGSGWHCELVAASAASEAASVAATWIPATQTPQTR